MNGSYLSIMSECLNCKKPIETHTGRRPRKFCSDNCRATYNSKNRPKTKKWVQQKTFEKVVKEKDEIIANLKAQILGQPKINPIPQKTKETVVLPTRNQSSEKPQRLEGEHPLDYAERVNEWKKSLNK